MVSLPAPLTASWRQRCSDEISSEYESGDSPNEWAMVARTGPAQSASLVVLRGMAINGDWCAMVCRWMMRTSGGQVAVRDVTSHTHGHRWCGALMSALTGGTNSTSGQAATSDHCDIATSSRKVPSNNNKPKMASTGRVPQGEVVMNVSSTVRDP